MKKIKFDIGDWVEAKAVVSFGYSFVYGEENKRRMFLDEVKRKGRIVGMVYRCLGIGQPHFGFDCPSTIKIQSKVLVYQIRDGMINIPFECLEEDLTKILPEDFPFCKSYQIPWTDEDRRQMAEYVKDQPRDSKGRWTK